MRILLAYPPHRVPFDARVEPLGVQYIAAAVPGHETVIVDGFGLNLDAHDMVDRAQRFEPDVVGISTPHNPQMPVAREFAELVRERMPGVIIVWGGSYPTYRAVELITDGLADHVVRHEGDLAFSRLIEALDGERVPDRVPGVTSWDRERREVVDGGEVELIEDLGQLPILAHDLPGYPDPYNSYSICASRGCPFDCDNCSTSAMWLHQRRQRPADHVLREIEGLIDRHGPRLISFIDDLFSGQYAWVRELCTGLSGRYEGKVPWVCNTRVDYLTEELIAGMAGAGCERVFLGIESGSVDVLRRLNKPYTPDQALDTVETCLQHGIRPHVSLMIGLPWETRRDLELTVEFLRRAIDRVPGAHFGIRHVTPVLGTKLHQDRERFGLTIHDDDQANLDLLVARVSTTHLTREDINRAYFECRILVGRSQAAGTEAGEFGA